VTETERQALEDTVNSGSASDEDIQEYNLYAGKILEENKSRSDIDKQLSAGLRKKLLELNDGSL